MKKVWLHSVVVTIFTFGLMWALDKVTELKVFNAFDPISQALSDFELTDYAFSKLRDDPKPEERIVLVNIGHLPRAGIAEQIRIISQFNPRVIGIDAFFNCEGGLRDTINCPQLLDTLGNLMLANAIEEAGNVVLVSKLLQSRKLYSAGVVDVYDSIQVSDSIFHKNAVYGFANLPTDARYQEDVKICRSFMPAVEVGDEEKYPFAVQLAMKYDSIKTLELLARNNEEEIINFRGNIEIQDVKLKSLQTVDLSTTQYPVMFYALDVDQVFKGEFLPGMITDNIVIFGFLGERFGDPSWNDKFYTPLNNIVAGRANPDMFGLVVHANILAMILNGDYIDELADWHKYAIAFIFCYLNIALFFYINDKFPVWFDSMSLAIQILQIVLLMGFTIWIFSAASFKLDLTITLAVIAIAGPCFEVYDNILNTGIILKWRNKLTKRKRSVFITQNEEIS